jgi:catechol 2,3-dioxygenase-like lactoylglutathione lyase family enzyme
MEMQTWHRGRLIDHIQLVVRDLEASKRFYSAVFEVLGVPMGEIGQFFYWDEFVINQGEPLTGRSHVAFQAKDRAVVDRFYKAALAAGGKDNGAPGLRDEYHPGYSAAFVLDPDGNNIEAVHHGPAKRSAVSVVITAEG